MPTAEATTGIVRIGNPTVKSDKIPNAIAALPPEARAIFKTLRKRNRDDEFRREGLRQTMASLLDDKQRLQTARGGLNDADIAKKLAIVLAEINDIAAEQTKGSGDLLRFDTITGWLSRNSHALRMADIAVPRSATLEKIREDQASITLQIKRTGAAPLPVEEVRAKVHGEFGKLVEAGKPKLDLAFKLQPDHDGRRRQRVGVEWPRSRVLREVSFNKFEADFEMPDKFVFDGFAFTAWAMEDALRAKLDSLVDEHAAKFPNAIPTSERASRTHDLQMALLRLQYVEGALCRAGGEDCLHDLPVPCALGIEPADEGVDLYRFVHNERTSF